MRRCQVPRKACYAPNPLHRLSWKDLGRVVRRSVWDCAFLFDIFLGAVIGFFSAVHIWLAFSFYFPFPSFFFLRRGWERRYSGVLRQEGARFPITGPLIILPKAFLFLCFYHTGRIYSYTPYRSGFGLEGEGVRGGGVITRGRKYL